MLFSEHHQNESHHCGIINKLLDDRVIVVGRAAVVSVETVHEGVGLGDVLIFLIYPYIFKDKDFKIKEI